MSSTDEQQTTQDDELKAAREALRAARDEVHSLVATLNAEDALTDEMERRYKSDLKGLGRLEKSQDVDRIRSGLQVYEKMKEKYRTRIIDRLGRGALPDSDTKDDEAASSDRAEGEQQTVAASGNGHRMGAREVVFLGDTGRQETGVDELLDKHHEVIAKKMRVLLYMLEEGLSGAKAVEKAGIDRTGRWATQLRRDYEEEGFRALIDGRWIQNHPPTVMTGEVRKLLMVEISNRRAAGPTAIWRNVREKCEERDIDAPSCSSVKEFMASLSRLEVAFLVDDEEGYRRNGRPVTRFETAEYANDRFQIDHTKLNMWVRMKEDGEWVPRRPWLTALLDTYSRSIAGFHLSTAHPDGTSVALAVLHAALPKEEEGWLNRGLPDVIQYDHGSDFMSNRITAGFASLGIFGDPIPPGYPEANGKIERWFQTLDRGLLRRLPGHIDAIGKSEGAAKKRIPELMGLKDLRRTLTVWVTETYHKTGHNTINETPAERWERTVHLREPAKEQIYRSLLLKKDKTRVIQNDGITLTINGEKRRYWGRAIAWTPGREVRLAYHEEIPEILAVYCAATAEFIGWARTDVNVQEVKRVRGRIENTMTSHIDRWREEIAENDRKKAGGDAGVDPGPAGAPSSRDGRQSQDSDDQNPEPEKSDTKSPDKPSPQPAPEQDDETEDLDGLIEEFKEQDRAAS